MTFKFTGTLFTRVCTIIMLIHLYIARGSLFNTHMHTLVISFRFMVRMRVWIWDRPYRLQGWCMLPFQRKNPYGMDGTATSQSIGGWSRMPQRQFQRQIQWQEMNTRAMYWYGASSGPVSILTNDLNRRPDTHLSQALWIVPCCWYTHHVAFIYCHSISTTIIFKGFHQVNQETEEDKQGIHCMHASGFPVIVAYSYPWTTYYFGTCTIIQVGSISKRGYGFRLLKKLVSGVSILQHVVNQGTRNIYGPFNADI